MAVERPWTEKHVNEAKAALYRLAAEAVAREATNLASAWSLRATLNVHTQSEAEFLRAIRPASGAARILRTVRARAEGREVVDPPAKFYRLKLPSGCYVPRDDTMKADTDPDTAARFDDLESARAEANHWHDARVVPGTITRRRIVRAKDPS